MSAADVERFFGELSRVGRAISEETQTLKKNVKRPAVRCFAGGACLCLCVVVGCTPNDDSLDGMLSFLCCLQGLRPSRIS